MFDREVTTLKEFLINIISIYSEAQSLLRNLNSYNQFRIIEVNNCGINLMNFNLSEKQKMELIESGKNAVQKFLKKQRDDFLDLTMEDRRQSEVESVEKKSQKIKQEVKYVETAAKDIGFAPGFYVFAACQHISCEKYQKDEWILCGTHGNFDMHEIQEKMKCSSCKHSFGKLDKVALCACTCKMNMRTKEKYGNEKITKTILMPKDRAQIIEHFSYLKYLTFEIT